MSTRAFTPRQAQKIRRRFVEKDLQTGFLALEYGVSAATMSKMLRCQGTYAVDARASQLIGAGKPRQPKPKPQACSSAVPAGAKKTQPQPTQPPKPKGRRRALTDNELAFARQRYVHEKPTITVLANDFGVSSQTMLAVLMGQGTYANTGHPVKQPSERYRGNQKLSDTDVSAINTLRESGFTYEFIGTMFNVNASTAMFVVNGRGRFAKTSTPAPSVAQKCATAAEKRAALVAEVDAMIRTKKSAAEILDFVGARR